jgi:hypothetical protein
MHDCVLLFLLSVTWGEMQLPELVIVRSQLLPQSLSQLSLSESKRNFVDFLKKKKVCFIACVYYWQGSDAPLTVYDVGSHSADFCFFFTIKL